MRIDWWILVMTVTIVVLLTLLIADARYHVPDHCHPGYAETTTDLEMCRL